MNADRPRVLIEDWLPVRELGIESVRERSALHSLPPISFLHVWWARRPLVTSAAVVLGGLLPAWSRNLRAQFSNENSLADAESYHHFFLRLVGILGNPIEAAETAEKNRMLGVKAKANPFTYSQAYRNYPAEEDLDLMRRLLKRTWGEVPSVMDPTAGGGSIPFSAARLSIPTVANDLNGVAAAVLKAGVEFPAMSGASLNPHIQQWGAELVSRVEAELKEYFPTLHGETVTNYIWANAVPCPRTGRPVPLLKDKWLCKDKGNEAAVTVEVRGKDGAFLDGPRIAVVTGGQVDSVDASRGFVQRGAGVSPYDNLVIDADYIKAEAQAGRMTQILYAVVIRDSSGKRKFRTPTETDLAAIGQAESKLQSVRQEWIAEGFLPSERFPHGNDMRPVDFGMTHWLDMFTPRQALVHGTFAGVFAAMIPEVRESLGDDLGTSVLFELALMQGKALNYNSRLSFWHTPRNTMGNVFSKHDFAFMWTFAEFVGARAEPQPPHALMADKTSVYAWALSQVRDVYPRVANLMNGASRSGERAMGAQLPGSVTVTQGSAAHLPQIADGSIGHVCMDPPYYDNVMYAELADYFYVWEKHTLGRLVPEFFQGDLTDKENEAVANPSRFEDMGRRKRELADLDYESKMTAIFGECRRVLRDDGVLTVMFTHKRAEAWDTLGMGLLGAGFTIETSWPVNTEAEHSLHQANMNSAASTIMLVCRKRRERSGGQVFLDDIAAEIRSVAREALERYREFGIDGVDLLLSTYGPVLSVISEAWPVYSTEASEDGSARLLRPDEALDIARQEVMRLQRKRLVGKDTMIDNHTDFLLLAWETFRADEGIPFDAARLLALAVGGLDMDELARAKVLEKKSGKVRLLAARERVRRGGDDQSTGVRIDAHSFTYVNDALDTALYIWEVDGPQQAKQFLDRLGLTSSEKFVAAVQGFVNAVPRVKVKGEWTVPLAGTLDTLCTLYLPDVVLPEVTEIVASEPAHGDPLF